MENDPMEDLLRCFDDESPNSNEVDPPTQPCKSQQFNDTAYFSTADDVSWVRQNDSNTTVDGDSTPS